MEPLKRTKILLYGFMGIALISGPVAAYLDLGITSALFSVVVPLALVSYLLIRGLSAEERSDIAALITFARWFYISLLVIGALMMVLIGIIFSGG